MAANITEVTKDNFEDEVLSADSPVVVDFWADWCGPCHMLAPVFEELAGEYAGKLKFAKLNVDEAPTVAGQYGVMSIPTLIIFKNGEPTERIVGVQPKQAMKQQFDAAIS